MNTTSFFKLYFNNAKINSILIMSCDGVILDINQAFTDNFGYSNEDIRGQNFSILFNEKDRQNKLPELELQTVAAKRQIEFFLTETEELLERIFESSKEIPMMILDGGMKIRKANKPFLHLFELADEPSPGTRLSELPHTFWKSADIRKEISSIIIKNQPLRNRKFLLETKDGKKKILRFDSRIVESKTEMERKIFITIDNEIN